MKRATTYIFICLFIFVSLLIINYIFFSSKGLLVVHPDFLAVLDWAYSSHKNGFVAGFGNYMPFWPYFSMLYSWIVPQTKSMDYAIFLKAIIILIDSLSFLIILIFSKKIENKYQTIIYSLLLLSNVALYYNSIFWGQIDNIHTLFIALSLLSVLSEKYSLSGFFLVFAFLTKIVAVMYIPLIAIILLIAFLRERNPQILFYFLLGCFSATLVLFFPLFITGHLSEYITIQTKNITNYDCISGNAYNIWYLFTTKHDTLISSSDSNLLFRQYSYKTIGRILFFFTYTITFFPLFTYLIAVFQKKKSKISTNQILLVAILIPLVFFYFLTNIRERYAHSYLLFLTIYCFLNKRYILWYLASIPYFLQLESVLKFTGNIHPIFSKLHDETNIFNPIFISPLFLITIIYFISALYKEYFSSDIESY